MRRGIRGTWCRNGLAAALALGATGCQWLPVQVDPSLDPRRVSRAPAPAATTSAPASASTSAPVAMSATATTPGVPLPETPLRAISDVEAMAATAPTPLLDAALVQAQAVQDVMTGTAPPPAETALIPASAVSTPEPLAVAATPPVDDALMRTAAGGEAGALPVEAAIPEAATPPEVVQVAAATELAPPPPVSPEESWNAHFEALRRLAQERQAASDGEPWPLRAAVLDWLGDGGPQQNDARTVIWTAFVESLAQAASYADASESTQGPVDDNALRGAIEALEDQLPLRVGTLALCRKVQGFGQYEPIADPSCRAGQTVVLYCELEGLEYEPEAEGGRLRSRLESTVVLRASEGDRVLWSQSLGTAEDVCRRRRRDYYVNYRLTLPDAVTLPPGTYRLQVQQRDAIAGREATAEIPLTIAATPNG